MLHNIPYSHILVKGIIPFWGFRNSIAAVSLNSTMELNKESWQDRVRRLYKARGFTQAGFAEKLGMSQSGFSKWLTGAREPSLEDFKKMAQALSTEHEEVFATFLIFGNGDEIPKDSVILKPSKEIPVVGTTQAGPPDRIWEEISQTVGYSDQYLEITTSDPHAYALRVVGNSMVPRILEGEWLLIEPSQTAQPGDDVIVKTIKDEVMVKQLLMRFDGTIILVSVNEAYDRITLKASDIVYMHFVAGRFAARSVKQRIADQPESRRISSEEISKERRSSYRLPNSYPDEGEYPQEPGREDFE